MSFAEKFKQLRREKELSQQDVTDLLGYSSNSYVSDVELGKFIPHGDKLEKLAKALKVSKEKLELLVLEDKLERLGLDDPSFTMMFKDIPSMTKEEKGSLIRAYQSVLRAREFKRKMRKK